MSSIVFADKEPAELPPALAQITAGAFWPPVNLVDVRAAVRIDHTVTHERLHYAATAAVVYVNQQLAAFQAAMLQKGIAALVQISLAKASSQTRLTLLATVLMTQQVLVFDDVSPVVLAGVVHTEHYLTEARYGSKRF